MRRKAWRLREWVLIAALVCVVTALPGHGAVIYSESFTDTAQGWTGTGDLAVEWHPVGISPGSLEGTFTDPGGFTPLVGAFRADSGASGGNFTGDYLAEGAEGFQFAFLAQDAAPSDLTLYLHGGGYTFLASLSPPSVGGWSSYSVPFTIGPWIGGSEAEFATALGSVDWVRLELAESGQEGSEERYYLDNFALMGDINGPPGVVIPEPGQGLFLLGAMLILGMRQRLLFSLRT